MVLPASGRISISAIRTEFGTNFSRLSNLYSIASGIPTSGRINFGAFYSKSASTPSVSTISNQNVNTASAIQNLTLNLSSYVTDTYGGTLTYSVSSYSTSYVTSASISVSTLSYSVPVNKFANTTSILVTVTNRFSKTATITVPLFITGYAIATSSTPSSSLSNNTATYTVSSYFTDYSGTGLTYSITSNPYTNASLSGTTLSIVGNYRNTTYSVSVRATNSYSQTATVSFSVTESASVSYSYPPGSMTADSTTFSGLSYGNGTYTSSASSFWPPNPSAVAAWKAFDNTPYMTMWYCVTYAYNSAGSYQSSTRFASNTPLGEWLRIDMPTAIIPKQYTISPRSDSLDAARGLSPKSFSLWGSNDGSTWTQLDSQTNITGWNQNTPRTFTMTNNSSYSKFVLITTQVTAEAANSAYNVEGAVNIGDLRLIT